MKTSEMIELLRTHSASGEHDEPFAEFLTEVADRLEQLTHDLHQEN